jgi:hypothetical protein
MTASANIQDERPDRPTTIGGDRRGERRYGIQLDIRWKLLHRRRVLDSGTGRTRDLSSHGILFETGRLVPTGSHLEVSVSWPALLHGVAALKLVAAGRVIRSDGTCAAIRITQHEFRTAGANSDRAKAATSTSASLPLWNLGAPANFIRNQ